MKKDVITTKPDKAFFEDRDKEAAFWEKNFDEAWVAGKAVKVKVSRNLSQSINVRLDPKTISWVRETASKKGLGPTQLIRMWIKEKASQAKMTTV